MISAMNAIQTVVRVSLVVLGEFLWLVRDVGSITSGFFSFSCSKLILPAVLQHSTVLLQCFIVKLSLWEVEKSDSGL